MKPRHFQHILERLPPVGWFEVHPENYLSPGGPMLHYLERIREHYPLSFHSVGMSLGSHDGIDEAHLRCLKALADRFEPALVSDHLSWSRWEGIVLPDLLPVPYTAEALRLMCENVDRVQNILGRRIAIENPSTYVDACVGELDECEFLIRLAEISGAALLLDVNNVYVSARNHGWPAEDYIARIPSALVSEIHLAGHSVRRTVSGEVRIDDHGSPVCAEVWRLYGFTLDKLGPRPTLIEWDTDVPAFEVLTAEAAAADAALSRHAHVPARANGERC